MNTAVSSLLINKCLPSRSHFLKCRFVGDCSSKTALYDVVNGLPTISAWSVNGSALNSPDIASNLFQVSLPAYLLLLFFLSRPLTRTPMVANFGFQFLLVFVIVTIPAGIYSKIQYHDILSNVDILHGPAETLLTVTNLLIISGFREARPKSDNQQWKIEPDSLVMLFTALLLFSLQSTAITNMSVISNILATHSEPSNALSIPTWAVHTSSLLEWLVAMKLIWEHADTSGNPRWKGMAWAMIPSHASGLCACVFHLFYNSPVVMNLVALQALLTIVGNTAMAGAAFRIYKYEADQVYNTVGTKVDKVYNIVSAEVELGASQPQFSSGAIKNPVRALQDSEGTFWMNIIVKSIALAVVVKYGELLFEFPFHPALLPALLLVAVPTLSNVIKWSTRSKNEYTREL